MTERYEDENRCSGMETCAGCGMLEQERYAVGNAAQQLGKPAQERVLYRCRANGYAVGAGCETSTWPHARCPKRRKERKAG